MAHAKLSPSSSKRWLLCTSSVPFVDSLRAAGKIPREETSIYAQEGIEAHEWASRRLKGEIQASGVPEDIQVFIEEYVTICEALKSGEADEQMIVEGEVPLFYSKADHGTVDFAVVNSSGIHIRDYKHGAGVPVAAEENTQLAIYAQSLVEDLETWYDEFPDHTVVTIGIHQPRYTGDESLKVWETTVGELREFCRPISNTARKIEFAMTGSGDLKFHPSPDTCQFCPAKAICSFRAAAAFDSFPTDITAMEAFENLELPPPGALGVEVLVNIWRNKKAITQFVEAVEEHLTGLALAGHPVDGTKLVQGRQGNREWEDEKAAERLLVKHLGRQDAFKKELISVATAEKLLKPLLDKDEMTKVLPKLITRSEGKNVLAPVEDKRPAVTAGAQHFDILTDEEDDV